MKSYLAAAAILLAGTGAVTAQDKPAPPATATQTPPASTTPAAPPTPAPAPTAAPAGATPSPAPAAKPAADASGIAPGVTLAPKTLAVRPGHYVLDPAHGKITWSVSHLGFSVYVGQFTDVSAELDLDPKDIGKTSLTATVRTDSVGTFNPELDKQLKGAGFLDTAAYPAATFKSTRITITGPQTAHIEGDLTLDGKTAPIVISATFNNAGMDPIDRTYTAGFDAAAIIRRSQFGASKYVPLVGDDVTLRIEGEFKLRPS